MKRVLIFLLLSLSCASASGAFPTGWQYRKPLTDGNSTTVTDFETKITLTSANFEFAKAQADGDDIRVWDDTAGALVPHWIEAWDANAQTATVWFKATDIANDHYLYYGFADATDASDGDSVFTFFDDFGARKSNEGTWEQMTDFPVATHQLVCEVIGDTLYAGSGGTTPGAAAYTAKFYSYDLTQGLAGTWTELDDIPVAVESATMRAVGGKLYFFGGQNGTPADQLVSVYEFDPAGEVGSKWTAKTNMPQKREDHGSAVIDSKVYLFGGRTPDFIAAVDFFTPATNAWDSTTATNWPVPRQLGDLACAYDGAAYLVSGTTDMSAYSNETRPVTRVDKYVPATDTWSELASCPIGVCYKEVVEVGGKLYVLGGTPLNAQSLTPYVQVYDVAANTWSYGIGKGISANGVAATSSAIYTVGGITGVANTASKQVWKFTPNASFSPPVAGTLDTDKWTTVVSGTGGAATMLANSAIRLQPTDRTISSVGLVSVPTVTNGIIFDVSRVNCSSKYVHFGIGSGSLQDNAGGSSNWWLTVIGGGYTVLGNDLQGASNTLYLKECPAGGAFSDVASALQTVVDDSSRHTWSLAYTALGGIVVKRDATQLFSATDTTFLNDAKKVYIGQGEYSDSNGDPQIIDWARVRTYAATEPSITLGDEEPVSSGGRGGRMIIGGGLL